ncbi:hypothetical protein QE152_g32493 [Popillia japonica]|uniref:Uncharacterized protein n=1 Tax=Popillia japonica TaxID=7064 RepID=A0AAW1IYX1_POPJA
MSKTGSKQAYKSCVGIGKTLQIHNTEQTDLELSVCQKHPSSFRGLPEGHNVVPIHNTEQTDLELSVCQKHPSSFRGLPEGHNVVPEIGGFPAQEMTSEQRIRRRSWLQGV